MEGPAHPKAGQLVDSVGLPSQKIYVEQARGNDPMGVETQTPGTKFQRTSHENATPLTKSYLQTCYGDRAKVRDMIETQNYSVANFDAEMTHFFRTFGK